MTAQTITDHPIGFTLVVAFAVLSLSLAGVGWYMRRRTVARYRARGAAFDDQYQKRVAEADHHRRVAEAAKKSEGRKWLGCRERWYDAEIDA